ncbi:AAA family ATPase [Falsiroseomonas sp. E2-1-a20]|uniref:AAA family ATPase n=1 Tax=Falsiroseomonas sp. E2-1-a20 TaxID=3239300 RepID=UPI003F315402
MHQNSDNDIFRLRLSAVSDTAEQDDQDDHAAPVTALRRAVVFLASSSWLAGFGPKPPLQAVSPGLFARRLQPGDEFAQAREPRAAAIGIDTTTLPRLPLVVFASDRLCLDILAAAHRRAETLPDGGGSSAVWRLALALSVAGEGDDEGELAVRAAIAAAAAAFIAGLPASSAAAPFTRAAASLALARGGTGNELPGDGELRGLAEMIGLWPVPALRPDGTPLGLSLEGQAALRGAGAVFRPLFEAAAIALADSRPPGLVAPGPARPVLLAEPPFAAEDVERAAVDQYRVLLSPVVALPPPESAQVAAAVGRAFPWMDQAIQPLMREVALARLGGAAVCRLPALLLLGPPGVGKSRFCRAVAEGCGLPLLRLSAPEPSFVTELAGNGRGWRSVRPCAPMRAIATTGVRNPVLMLDDLDRAPTDDRYGTAAGVLLAMLEPETARSYLDPCLSVPVDISAVNWIATANSLAGIPDALLSRLLIVQVAPPPAEALAALLDAMRDDIAAEIDATPETLPALPDQARTLLRKAFSDRGATPRNLRLALRAALGALALGEDPLPAMRLVLEPSCAAIEVGFPRRTHEPR